MKPPQGAETQTLRTIPHKERHFDRSLAGPRLKTVDDTLRIFQDRDFNSPVVTQLPQGAEFQLEAASEFEGREWFKVTLSNGATGYVLGPSARGHTQESEPGLWYGSGK